MRTGVSLAAVAGAAVAVAVLALGFGCRRRWPALSFAALAAALCSLPTSNLFFASGVVLAERNLYFAVLLVAVAVGYAVAYGERRWGSRRTTVAVMALALVLAAGSFARLRAWRDNRAFLLTLLVDHPESYHAHASAAAVLAGLGDTAGARREYARAESLFSGDPHLTAAHALYLVSLGETTAAAALAVRARELLTGASGAPGAVLSLWNGGTHSSARAGIPPETGSVGPVRVATSCPSFSEIAPLHAPLVGKSQNCCRTNEIARRCSGRAPRYGVRLYKTILTKWEGEAKALPFQVYRLSCRLIESSVNQVVSEGIVRALHHRSVIVVVIIGIWPRSRSEVRHTRKRRKPSMRRISGTV